MALSGGFYNHDNPTQSPPKPASPASPSTSQFTAQQASRSFMNLNPTVRGQNPPFPTTPASAVLLEPPPGIQYMDFIRTWSDTHVSRWLTDIKCGSHAPAFKANDIRGDVLLELDQQTLKEMGVTSIGDRLRIVNAVKALRLKSSSRSSTTSQTARSRLESGNEARTTPLHDKGTTDRTDTAPNRPANRNARPAPLQLNQNAGRSDLPRLEHDSANRPNPSHCIRPLPLPHPPQTTQPVITPNSAHIVPAAGRPNLPPLPPLPQGKPPPPPARQPARPSGAQGLSGRRTPTQDPTTYGTALPTAPQNRDLLTPSSATNWTGYHLPADPRPGNLGGKPPPPRSTSPLPPGRSRSGLPVGASPPNKLLPRPSAGTNPHPYATQSTPTLQNNLSPISESFTSNSGNPSPSLAYTVGRGAFNNSNAPQGTVPLETLRRKLVKFVLPDEGLTSTIDAATCAGGVEVLEKVLKKFGKGGLRSTDSDSDYLPIEDGGLSIDGWAVYLSKGQDNNPGTPLTEAELLSICHAPPENPWREHGLIVRRLPKVKRHDDRGAMSSSTSRATKRASSISILSGLGVRDPERALDPPSPTSAALSPAAHHAAKRPSKLRNFFGQRPPSELITNHLTEFFPAIEKKVLERTARHSLMLRSSTFSSKRDSVMSIAAGSQSRFSNSTQGSIGSVGSPPRRSISPSHSIVDSIVPPLTAKPGRTGDAEESQSEEIPRMSLSTDDGRSIDLYSQDAGASTTTASPPQLLPPIPFPTESFSDSFDNITGRNVSRTASNASRRMSYMTELRSKRDRSDTASLMTVDEITAEVESRRASMQVDPGSDTDDWTKVDSDGLESSTLADQDLPKEVAPAGVEVDENEDEDSNNEGPEAMTSQGGKTSFFRTNISAFDLLIGNKWIKGALIGAGSFGKVYLGMDASTGLLMAVKQVELPTGSGPNQERKKSMLSALEREIELLKNLQHANIVQYLYSSIDDEYLNIFLEYVPGGSVTALIRNYGAFEEPLVKNFVRQILEGLNYLHERDIIHRDIKGANILVDNKGGIKISDFGISKKVDDNLLTGNRVNRPSLQGSVFWMAPEVVKQSAHTQKADIWSVGCLVVEMLTGEHPWAQLTQMQAIFKIGSSAKPSIPSDISAEAQEFLRLTFELDHEARPSAAELLQHLWISKKSKGGKNATSFESA
ncbi:Protein kinase byr2 [Termitomyces sp. T112]|nr:Protein kinase byr2 [Termitomyces sp. T112]